MLQVKSFKSPEESSVWLSLAAMASQLRITLNSDNHLTSTMDNRVVGILGEDFRYTELVRDY